MTCTNDERREVAERLREQAYEGYGVNLESMLYALGLDSDDEGRGDEYVFEMLADLIDPIPACHAEQDYDRDLRIRVRWWKCNGCGEHFVYERGFAPRFCPECGARLVTDDE